MTNKLLIIAFLMYFSPVVNQKNAISSYYEYINSNRPEDGLPSKCDCDYTKIELFLNNDLSFILKEQEGRLEIISLEIQYGKWQINSPLEIQLNVDSLSRTSKHQLNKPENKYFSNPKIIRLQRSEYNLIYKYDKVLHPKGKILNITE